MKKFISVFLIVCLFFTSALPSGVYAEEASYDLTTKTLTMTELSGKYKTQGRTVLQDGVLLAHYPATGIEFKAYCSGDVSVTFSVTSVPEGDLGGTYFTVIVDGVTMDRETCHITETGEVTVKIAEGLSEDEHTFELYRQNEIVHGKLGFKSITLDGELLDAPANRDTYIEFVGASQWGGYGNLADSTVSNADAPMPYYQDATKALTYLTAEKLDTDWSVVSVAGIGSYWCNIGYSMNTAYDYYGYYNDKTTLYDFARQPDYIVIGLGTNDVSTAEVNGKTSEDIYEAFNYFVRLMRMKNPNAKIIWVRNMMTDSVNSYVEKTVEDLGGAEYGVYTVKVTQNNDGGNSHPSAAGHEVMATEISEFIETIKDDTFISELPEIPESDETEGEVIIESDFTADTNWVRRTSAQVSYIDEDSDGVNDFVRLNGLNTKHVGIVSTPAEVIPGTKYELSFYARIPEGSTAFHTDTYDQYPRFAIYQPTLSEDGTKVTDYHLEGQNEYAYKNARRDDFIATWQISKDFAPYTRKGYSLFDSLHNNACAHISPDEIYKDWTKVTVEFTAIASEDNDGAETIALYFGLKKDSSVEDGCMFDIKDVKLINTTVESDESEEDANVVIKSDISDDSKWYVYPSYNGSLKDDNSDSVNDYYQLTTGSVNKATYLRSAPATLVPGHEYELSYYLRVPSDSPSYVTDTTSLYPKIAIYQPTVDYDTGKVTDGHSEGNNEYAYKGIRREAFSAVWTIGDYEPLTRTKYSILASQHYNICDNLSPNEVYSDWTKVTCNFTALEDDENVGSQVVALSIGLPKGIAGLLLDVKDVALIDKSASSTELPEGVIYYEDFENQTDDTVANLISNRTWSTPCISTTEAASGSKALSIYAMYEYLFIAVDKTTIEQGTIYEFSMDWKMLEYTETKKRMLGLYLVGYNPSNGETIKADSVKLAYLEDVKATGDWLNSSIRFKISDLSAYEQYGVLIRYTTSTPHTTEEDTIYIDNLKIAKADDQTALTPIVLTENERTEDTIKVLAFGNSFSNDATTFIPKIANADGTDIRVADCSIGGCSLERHYNNTFNGTTDYSFNYRLANGTQTFSKVSMDQALEANDWDYITIQQVSGKSGQIDTFEPYLSELIKYFKEACPNAEIRLHMTWAYQEGYSGLSSYEDSQSVMYEAIEDSYIAISKEYGFLRIIPSGEAIKRVRDTVVGDNLNRDGFHLNDKGRIIAALTWYETFTGISALDTKFDLTAAIGTVGDTADVNVGITAEEDVVMRTAAHEAATLFKKANETQLATKNIGTINDNSYVDIENLVALREELGNDDLLPNLDDLLAAINAYEALCVGDVTNDSKLNLKDLVTLARYSANWEDLSYNKYALDINGDDEKGLDDVVVFAQYLAGWDVNLGGIAMDYNSGTDGVVNRSLATYESAETGLKMPYTLLLPKNYNKAKEYPVLLFLHGSDALGTCNEKPIQKLEPFYDTDALTMSEAIILIPQCNTADDTTMGEYSRSGRWRFSDDGRGPLDVAMELLENEVYAKFNCDRDRFYVAGLSNGGQGTWLTLEKYGDVIAAAVPICGGLREETAYESIDKMLDTPIRIYHGTADATNPFEHSQYRYDRLVEAGNENVTLIALEGYDHNVWDYAAADAELIKWLFDQNLQNR